MKINTVKLNSTGETVVAKKDGTAKTFANRTQAENCARGMAGAVVINRGRPFYVKLTGHENDPALVQAAILEASRPIPKPQAVKPEAAPSPLPWSREDYFGLPIRLMSEMGGVAPSRGCVAVIDEGMCFGPESQFHANADYILRAVNSHAALVEALRAVAEALADESPCRDEVGTPPYKALQLARAALRAAGEAV